MYDEYQTEIHKRVLNFAQGTWRQLINAWKYVANIRTFCRQHIQVKAINGGLRAGKNGKWIMINKSYIKRNK